MKKLMLVSALLLSQSIAAAPNLQMNNALNALCQKSNVVYQNKNVLLNLSVNNQAQVFFIKNNSPQSLWLDHTGKVGAANAGWASYLRPGNWSAIYVTQKSFELTCSMIEPGKVNYLPCEQRIAVCSPGQVNVPTKQRGSFWIAEDKSWKEMLRSTLKRGFKLVN